VRPNGIEQEIAVRADPAAENHERHVDGRRDRKDVERDPTGRLGGDARGDYVAAPRVGEHGAEVGRGRHELGGVGEERACARIDVVGAAAPDRVQLTRRAVATAVQVAAEHDGRAETGSHGDEREIVESACNPAPALAEGGEIDVVLERHRHAEPGLELVTEIDVAQAGDVAGKGYVPVVADDARNADDRVHHHSGLHREGVGGFDARVGDRRDVHAAALDVPARTDVAAEIAHADAEEPSADVEAEREPRLGHRLEVDRPVVRPARRLLRFPDEPGISKGLERKRDRRLRDAGLTRDLGARDGGGRANRIEHGPFVQVAQQRGNGPRPVHLVSKINENMRIAVIGGGSTYTPELVSGLTRLEVDEVVLQDIDPERREVVGGMAERMLARQGYAGGLEVTGDLDRAVEGADFVLVQIRVGGQEARLHDETVPLACGCIGQETTGAGGFAKAMRTVPVVLDIADRVRELAAPDAWIVDFTNPVGIVTRALLDAGHRAIGLCNVAIGFQRRFAAWLGAEPRRVVVDQVGLNHLTWVRRILLDGEDVLPSLLAEHGDELAADIELPRRVLDELGAVPSYYLRYFYAHDEVLREQLDGVPRAQVVSEIERGLLELYRDPSVDERPDLLMQRGGAYYSEAALGLVASLSSGDGAVHEVDARNNGTLVGLADDDAVEVPARVDRDGAHPLPQPPLAPELLGLAQHVAAYERLTVKAALSRDPVDARKALLAHPLIGQVEMIDALLDPLLTEAVR